MNKEEETKKRIKPRRKRVLLSALSILLLSACLSACGGKGAAGGAKSGQNEQAGMDAETKASGIDMVDRFNLENPEQVVCGQTCIWTITTRLDGFIYQIDYESGVKEIKEIEWRQGEGERYLLAPQFYFFSVLIHPEYACPLEEWNTDTFLSMIEENGWEKNIYNVYQSNPLSLLYQIFACNRKNLLTRNREQRLLKHRNLYICLPCARNMQKTFYKTEAPR